MAVGLHATNLANKILNHLRGGTAWTAPSGIYVRLHTGDPGAAGTANAAAGDTSRQQVTFGAASGGAIATNGTAPSWTNGGTSETLTHVSFWDAATGGGLLFTAALASSRAWVASDTFTIPAGATFALTPLAT